MVDIVVTEQTKKTWQTMLVSYQELLGCEFMICSTLNHNVYQSVASSFTLEENLHKVQDIDAFTKSVLANNDLLTREKLFHPFSYVSGLPIYWPSESHYGALLVLKNTVVTPRERIMLDTIISQIEKDLILVFKDNQRRFEADLAKLIQSYPTPEFQTFIDSFQDHLWVKNINGVYTHCNQLVSKAWGKPLSEIIGKTDAELFDEEIAEKFIQADLEVITAGKQIVVEECANGVNPHSKTWLETIKAPMVNSNGQIVGTIGMTRNVSNRKAIEDQLLVAATVFENSVEGVVITNKEGMIIYVNKAFCDITGYSEIESIGRNPRFMKSGRHDLDFYKNIWDSLFSEGQWKGEIWNRRKNGEIFPEMSTISVVYDDNKEICNYVAVFTDISQQKQQEQDLQHMAYHDPLTDLPNRTKMSSQIEQEIYIAKRQHDQFATIFIDVDHFKHINDTYGHLVGDEVLIEVASRLKETVREIDTVSRIGGDEFVLLLPGIRDLEAVSVVAHKIMSIFDKPIELSDLESFRLTASMGIALYPQDGEDSELLLSNADAAMYRAKQTGRNNYAYYTRELTKESEDHLKLQGAMHDAIEQNGFNLVYQPQVDMETGKYIGFESLIRWNDPKLGDVPPNVFIPIAEKTGLIQEIGLWVLKTACAQAVKWRDSGYQFEHIAVNVAGPQLQRDNFAQLVISVLEEAGLEAKFIELEVTEGFMVSNAEEAMKQLDILSEYGISLAMDDFGTGYSSLSYLQQLPLDKIKIDQSFVKSLPDNSQDTAIANAIIALGTSLSLRVIAEGVESKEQVEFLTEKGCLQAQGYYFSKPLSGDELTSILSKTVH